MQDMRRTHLNKNHSYLEPLWALNQAQHIFKLFTLYYTNPVHTNGTLMENYPDHWPKPDRKQPKLIQSRVTEQQKLDLYNRNLTTRDLAKLLGVHETYLSSLFPGKVPIIDKKPLIEARRAYNTEMAALVLSGRYTAKEAATIAHTTVKTMRRFMKKVELARASAENLAHQEDQK